MTTFETFGEWVRLRRKGLGLTQSEMGNVLDVTATYISKIENGKVLFCPSQHVLNDIASLFDVDEETVYRYAGYFDTQKLLDAIEQDSTIADKVRKLYQEVIA